MTYLQTKVFLLDFNNFHLLNFQTIYAIKIIYGYDNKDAENDKTLSLESLKQTHSRKVNNTYDTLFSESEGIHCRTFGICAVGERWVEVSPRFLRLPLVIECTVVNEERRTRLVCDPTDKFDRNSFLNFNIISL